MVLSQGCFCGVRSDGATRWPDVDAYANKDASGQAHYPGWTVEALKYLYEDRQISAVGMNLSIRMRLSRRTKQDLPLSLTYLARITTRLSC